MVNQFSNTSFSESAADNYERYFVPAIGAPLAAGLIPLAGLRAGHRVLDVACGTGVVARLAHSQVGHNGSVVGLDVNPAMLAAARVATPPELSVEWHHANAESMPFPDSSFDAVLCQMALQFVPDKQAALREMRRVLAPGGRIALNLAGPTPPLFAVLAEVLALRTPEAAGFIHNVFSLHDVTEIRNLMESAGFPDATAESRKVSLCLPPPREFLLQYIHSTPLAGFVMQLNDESRTSMERDAVAHWQSFVKDGALEFTVRVVLVSARK